MVEKTLTDRQQAVLDFVERFSGERGFPPTLREIGRGVGVANVNAVRGHVNALEKKGYITRTPDKARSISVVQRPSRISRLRKRLHRVLRTDQGVLHRLAYGLAWTTWDRAPHFAGPKADWLAETFRQEALERGWTLHDMKIAPDHVVMVVEAWPNHSPELTVRRLKAAGRALKRKRSKYFQGLHLWAKGYAATTDLDLLDALVEELLGGQPDESAEAGAAEPST
ncbi:MAG: LexA family protein [Planctomycetota bacterium]|jgi:REP element-mobilizing transposase RayT